MNFEFDKVRFENLTAHLRCEYSLLRIPDPRSVGKQLHMFAIDVGEHVVGGLVHHVDALHCHCYHLGFRSFYGFLHHIGRRKFPCAHKEAGCEFSVSDF